MFDYVARCHAEGDMFNPERLRLLRLLGIAMGAQRKQAGDLLEAALQGDRDAEQRIRNNVAALIIQT